MKPLLFFTIVATVSFSAIAQIAFKIGMTSLRAAQPANATAAALAAMTSPFIWAGLIIYASSLIVWLWVLSQVEVSAAYPFVGISFVLTALIGAMYLHENVTPMRIAGTLLVICGCVLIARSA
jgi:multidrug transporter EmrE-like cation transporter